MTSSCQQNKTPQNVYYIFIYINRCQNKGNVSYRIFSVIFFVFDSLLLAMVWALRNSWISTPFQYGKKVILLHILKTQHCILGKHIFCEQRNSLNWWIKFLIASSYSVDLTDVRCLQWDETHQTESSSFCMFFTSAWYPHCLGCSRPDLRLM